MLVLPYFLYGGLVVQNLWHKGVTHLVRVALMILILILNVQIIIVKALLLVVHLRCSLVLWHLKRVLVLLEPRL
jgi:hypothetical protein